MSAEAVSWSEAQRRAEAAGPTLLVGLDGATFTVLDALMEDDTMPFLRRLVSEGARARLLSTANPLTPPAWTTLMTGRTPGHHGVFDFARVVRHEGIPRSRLATSRDVAVETIWAIASRQGRTVTVLNFPITYPPRPIRGSLVPGWVRWRHLRRSLYPADLWDALSRLPGFNAKELALDWEMERKALMALPQGEYADWVRFHIRRERQWMEIARFLMQERPADLTAVLFDGVDKLQHLCWRFIDREPAVALTEAWEREVRGLCLDYFRQLDRFLEELAGRAGEEGRVFLASDHGFGPTTEILYPNVWLQREGLLAWGEGVGVVGSDQLNVEGHRDPSTLFDWTRTKACVLSAGGSGVWIRQAPSPSAPGVQPQEYDAFRRRLRDRLLLWKDESGAPVLRGASFREEAFPGPRSEGAPDILLVLRDGASISVLNAGEVRRPRHDASGAHRFEGIFVARGRGVRRGAVLDDLPIADVAATLLYSAGLPVPEDLEGKPAVAAFTDEHLAAHPPAQGPPTEPPEAFPAQPIDLSAEQDEEGVVLERLKALGYIE